MQVDWQKMTGYLAVPGTNDPLIYSEGDFRSADGGSRFTVNGHVVDFLGETAGDESGSTAQMDYWESSKPGLRAAEHFVQTLFAEQRFEYISRFVQFDDVSDALDIGCGNGVGTVSLKRRVDTVFGLDMSAYLLWQMPGDIVGIRGDASRLPLRDNSVDLAMAWEIIHHIIDPVPVLAEMRRVSRKWVVLFDPNRWNPLQAGFSLVVSKERLGLRNTRRYLTKIMDQAGLKVVHYATVGCIFPNKSPRWLARILCKAPFRIPFLGISHLLISEVL